MRPGVEVAHRTPYEALLDDEVEDARAYNRRRHGHPTGYLGVDGPLEPVERALAKAITTPRGPRRSHRGLCPFCGALTQPGAASCAGHRDLLELDPTNSKTVRTPTVTRRTA